MPPPPKTDAACMDEIERTERKSSVQANPSRITPPAMFLYEAEQISISSFVLRTQRAVYTLDDMLARDNSVCLLALSRSDRRILALLIVARVDCAVLCYVVAKHHHQVSTINTTPVPQVQHSTALYCAVLGGSRYLIMLGDNTLVYTRTSYVQQKVPQKTLHHGRRHLF